MTTRRRSATDIHPKVAAATAAAAAAIVIVWLLGLFGIDASVEVGTAIATLLAFAGGYLKSA